MIGSPSLPVPTVFEFDRPVSRPPAGDAPSLWTVDAVGQRAGAERLAPAVLDAGELARAGSFHRDEDRRCYVAAHVALRVLLGDHLGVAAARVPLVREPCPNCGGPHGRPAVDGNGVHFSLSHAADLALLAVAGTAVGVDVERIAAPRTVAEVSASLHPTEIAELDALPESERPAAFTRAWARKESYLKGIGTGLSRSLALDYVGTGPLPAPGPGGWIITDVAVPEGYAAAVAVPGPRR
ncbi:4'-phosphopantetheinyl transferase superfamily protein [Streptomyces sp. GC420]|uniref:4'-phosphopantetheinyl transferase family protein n=1 Tax=Streptomyces sp. GC420 TaxID=2697568 RepID=UPI0014152301|nr:4'-phosphopantetheinyl transferase superfamily protein [Streptomyces sp. GC420]NBM18471.1 4'-phosphopantetheinyl transferase superfamily protein [Streptomyces sp. GC420]